MARAPSALSLRVLSAAAVLVTVSGLVACSGSSDPPSVTAATQQGVTEPSAATAPPTSSPATSTTTSASPVTSAPASVAETTPTTVGPTPEESIRQSISSAQEAFSACLVAMPACDPNTLAAWSSGELLDGQTKRVRGWNEAGYTVRRREQFRFVTESVTIEPSGVDASAIVCIADDSDLVLPGAAPDGGDVIVDDAFLSERENWMLHLDPDGVWRTFSAPRSGPAESTDVCPAA